MIPQNFITEAKAALNTAAHATVAALAAGIPANVFTNWSADEAWLISAGAAGGVAVAHAVGRALQAVKYPND